MADMSLDAYIDKNKFNNQNNFNRKPQQMQGNRQNAGFNRPRTGFDARQRLSTKPQVDARQKLSTKKPAVVDARIKLKIKQEPTHANTPIPDARQKIMQKTKFSDARTKIQLKKNVDAREKIKARQGDRPNAPETQYGTKMTASGMVVNIPSIFKTVSQASDVPSRTVNNTPQPVRHNEPLGLSNVSMTRVINNDQSQIHFQSAGSSLRKTIQIDEDLNLDDFDLDYGGPPPLTASNFVISRPNSTFPSNIGQERPTISFTNDRFQQPNFASPQMVRHQPHTIPIQQPAISAQPQQRHLGTTSVNLRSPLASAMDSPQFGGGFQVQRPHSAREPEVQPPLRLYRAPEDDLDEQIDGRTKITRLLTRPVAPPRPEKNTLLSVSGETMSPLQGFRVLIGNLHSDVTQEDVAELFGAVGPLKKARLVKQGVAEVVFVKCEDAVSAVKKYHLRELDSQPMTVKFAAGTMNQTMAAQASSQSSNLLRKQINAGESKRNADPIDASIIHRALFKGTSTRQVKPEAHPTTFTVRV